MHFITFTFRKLVNIHFHTKRQRYKMHGYGLPGALVG